MYSFLTNNVLLAPKKLNFSLFTKNFRNDRMIWAPFLKPWSKVHWNPSENQTQLHTSDEVPEMAWLQRIKDASPKNLENKFKQLSIKYYILQIQL